MGRLGTLVVLVVAVVLLADGSAEATTAHLSPPDHNWYPKWSPDGSRIAFVRGHLLAVGAAQTIWVMNADGSDVKKLVSSLAEAVLPSWSPDGTKVAFSGRARASDEDQIYIVNSDGSGLTSLEINGVGPAWSPRGDKIAFMQWGNGPPAPGGFVPSDIYVANPDGSGVKNLTNSPEGEDFSLAWSPDGSKLAFSRLARHDGVFDFDLYVMNADGSGVTALATTGATEWPMAWSPDGSRILFFRDGSAGQPLGLYVMKSDGSEIRQLPLPTGIRSVDGDWSHGGKIAFDGALCNGCSFFGPNDIYTVNLDGSDLRNLTKMYGGDPYGPLGYDSLRIVPAAALAGKKLTAIMKVTDRETQGRVEQGTAVCRASIAKRASGLAVVRRLHAVAHVFAESSARCTWRIPRSAKGKFVTATVTVRSGQFHLGWTFSRHVR